MSHIAFLLISSFSFDIFFLRPLSDFQSLFLLISFISILIILYFIPSLILLFVVFLIFYLIFVRTFPFILSIIHFCLPHFRVFFLAPGMKNMCTHAVFVTSRNDIKRVFVSCEANKAEDPQYVKTCTA
jgi:hypothetical protein